MKKFVSLLLVSSTVIACTSQDTPKIGEGGMKRLEVLHAVNPQNDIIGITVTGHGCTMPEHFDIQVEHKNNKCQVSIFRIRPDFCRRASMPISLELPWNAQQACGGNPIEITNPKKPTS
jgi:hypothetical protein